MKTNMKTNSTNVEFKSSIIFTLTQDQERKKYFGYSTLMYLQFMFNMAFTHWNILLFSMLYSFNHFYY